MSLSREDFVSIARTERVIERSKGKEAIAKKAQWKARYDNTRINAIVALGGRCATPMCNADISNIHIVALTPETKAMNQIPFYNKIIYTYRKDATMDKLSPREFAIALCAPCRYKRMREEADIKREAKLAKVRAAQGQVSDLYYWVAGEKVKQLLPGSTGFYEGKKLAMPKIYQHKDIDLFGEDY